MATISALYTFVEDYCKGVSLETTLINRATIRMLRDFCEQTKIVKEDLTAINVVASTQNYTLTLPTALWAYTELVEVEDVMFKADGAATTTYTRLTAVTRDELRRYLDPTYLYQTAAATPTNYYLNPNNDVLSLIPTPSANSMLKRASFHQMASRRNAAIEPGPWAPGAAAVEAGGGVHKRRVGRVMQESVAGAPSRDRYPPHTLVSASGDDVFVTPCAVTTRTASTASALSGMPDRTPRHSSAVRTRLTVPAPEPTDERHIAVTLEIEAPVIVADT